MPDWYQTKFRNGPSLRIQETAENQMKKIGEFWLPDLDVKPGKNLERTLAGYDGKSGIQIHHLEEALQYVDRHDLAIDGGANVGSWSKLMASHFDHVEAFEPNLPAYECLEKNITEWGLSNKITPHQKALSNTFELVDVSPPSKSRTVTSRILGSGSTQAITIDSLNLGACSFLKLDVEGYEGRALMGAQSTVSQYRPWIMIENKPDLNSFYGDPNLPAELLESWGYSLVKKIGDKKIDWLFKP